MPFDFSMLFQGIIDAADTVYGVIRGPLAALLLGVGSCLSGAACGPYQWRAKRVDTTIQTQFEIGYISESKIIIGFPGTVKATGDAEGKGDGTPAPDAPK